MTDYPKALAAAREALTKLREHDGGTRYNGDDDEVGERACCRVASWKPHDSDCPHAVAVAEFDNLLAASIAAQGEAVPAKGLRDSALNSARFRARCYALVGIVEGIAGLGRRWASDGERLKDTPEWVAFYNSVSAMRNGIAEPTSATQAPPAAVPAPSVEGRTVKEAWWAGARAALGIEDDTPRDQVASAFLTAAERAAQQPAAAVPEPMPPVPDSMGLSREQREVEDAFRRGWNSCRARVMQLNAAELRGAQRRTP